MTSQSDDDPRSAKMLKREVQLSFVVCAAFLATATAQAKPCKPSGHCVLAAEVDDAATIKARARIGSRPDAGTTSDLRIKTGVRQVDTLRNGIKEFRPWELSRDAG